MCKTLHMTVLLFASSLYLVIGGAIIIGSAATFFTKYGKILTPFYAGLTLSGGAVIFLMSIVGFMAACKERKKCYLTLFMLFDFLLLIMTVVAAAMFFHYEWVLHEAAKVDMDGDVRSGLATLDSVSTKAVKTVVDNAFAACDGRTTYATGTYTFDCQDTQFSFLGENVNMCLLSPSATNATAGSGFYECYDTTNWPSTPTPVTDANLLQVLNQPKGIFCACAETIVDRFLGHFKYTKYIDIALGAFFLLVFISCCYLCCTAKKNSEDDSDGVQLRQGWSAGSVTAPKKRQDAYIARP